ncbi:MAG: ABC transporter permease [Deltaproteobacteria bacterium]|jgi:NitT/TauT family transport system permease protein|nr:ABC transporter permease [Deltaproteobacteria bacterium]
MTVIPAQKKLLSGQFIFRKTIAIAIFLFIWQVFPSLEIINPRTLPPLSVVLTKLWQIIINGELRVHIAISLKRSVSGFSAAVVVAIPLGFMMVWSKKIHQFFNPIVQLFRNTSSLALYPVVLLIFGIGETAKFIIIFWTASWPLLISVIDGVRAVDAIYVKAAKSMSISTVALFFRVILPSTIPYILTGLRISATRSMVALVAAEMLGASSGLGYLIFDTQNKDEIDKMYAAIITLISIGMLINFGLIRLEKRLTVWKRSA